MRYSEEGLYKVLEKHLRGASEPMDCVRLFDIPEVREHAASANRVSDYLGNLWRRGVVLRVPSDGTSKARWAYQWVENKLMPKPAEAAQPYAPRLLVDRPTVVITEEGTTIQLEFPNLTILVKQKK